MAGRTSTLDTARAREEWSAVIEHLMSKIEKWAREEDWQVARLAKREITESALGTYSVSDLRIRTASGVLNVEVVARNVIGADGRVDLVAFPSLDRFMLIRTGGKWVIETDSGGSWPGKWGKKAFLELAQSLTKAP